MSVATSERLTSSLGVVALASLVVLRRLSTTGKPISKRFKTGAIVGKFYPPHKGHSHLINQAASQCEHVYVFVCWKRDEIPEGQRRLDWLREIHSGQTNVTIEAKEDVYHDDANSELWANLTRDWIGSTPEAVFTSEGYGEPWSRYLGCSHVLVDLNRKCFPVSGTMVRQDPYAAWDMLEPCVRQYYAKVVCIIGAESTGKTVLTNRLAMYCFGAGMVGEYGRDKTIQNLEERGPSMEGDGFVTPEWRTDDFKEIAENQTEKIRIECRVTPLVFADTDALATQIWHERYMNGTRSKDVEKVILNRSKRPDLYLFCVTDGVPFVQDGTRDGEIEMRLWMDKRFRQEMKDRPDVVILEGNYETRFTKAKLAIHERFPDLISKFVGEESR